jgi:hypothetical protein
VGAAGGLYVRVPSGQNEFRFSAQYNLLSSDPQAHDRQVSDHHLVLAAVRKEADDD